MKKFLGLLILTIVALTAGCKKSDNIDLSKFAKPEDFVSKDKPSEETAMKLLFGSYKSKEDTEYPPELASGEKEIAKIAGKNKLHASVLIYDTKKTSEGNKLVLITSSRVKENDDPPFISAFVFAETGGNWKLESKQYYLTESGFDGTPDDVKLVETSENGSFGLVFFGSEENDDASHTIIYLYEKKQFIEALNYVASADDGGVSDEEWSFDSDYKFVKGSSAYYDLQVVFKGNQYDSESGKMIDMNKTEKYTFANGKYVKQ